jgi:hypothetical protein
MHPTLTRHLVTCQRSLLVALTLCPIVLVTVALMPALVVLPFLPNGHQRAYKIILQLRAWTRATLEHSNPT